MYGGNDDGSVAVLEGSCKGRRGEFQIEVRDRVEKLTPVRDDCVEPVAPNLKLHVAHRRLGEVKFFRENAMRR